MCNITGKGPCSQGGFAHAARTVRANHTLSNVAAANLADDQAAADPAVVSISESSLMINQSWAAA